MKKLILLLVLINLSSCSFIHYRVELRKNQQKIYDSCISKNKDPNYCHRQSKEKIKEFEKALQNLEKI